MIETIFALSSGSPPAAIAVIRISGPAAGEALNMIAGNLPEPGKASLRTLRDPHGEVLDRALVLWFEGPASSTTGEDVAELHLHGGRAVVAAVEGTLAVIPKLRRATPGEFTRRAFANGRIDLAEAEGLGDLLMAETELQRRSAMAMASGVLSRQVERWRGRLLEMSASIEAALDFSDEDDVVAIPAEFAESSMRLCADVQEWLDRPRAETLREGFRVVLGGPPNAGKSSLFNALVDADAAITSEFAGTTRDVLTRTVAIAGVPFQFFDTAGLRVDGADVVERVGVERARSALGDADIVLWLGDSAEAPHGAWDIAAKCDLSDATAKPDAGYCVSAITGEGLDDLRGDLVAAARAAMPRPGQAALNARQEQFLRAACRAISDASGHSDPLLAAEGLRVARVAFDSLLGRTTTEDMLDTLFSRFCIGK